MREIRRILPTALSAELVRLGKAQNVMRRWEEVVGSALANRSAPERFERGVLWVAVEGSAWAQELRMMKVKILGKLNEFCGQEPLFADIRFGVRRLPPKKSELEPGPGAPGEERLTSIQAIKTRRLKNWKDVDPA